MTFDKKKIISILKWIGISFVAFFLLVTLLLYVFKGRIISYVVNEINQHLTAKVSVGKIDVTFWRTFPRVGVDFKDVLILDTTTHKNDTVFYSELIRLKFNAKELWYKKYVLQEAQIFPGIGRLKVYENGRENYMIFKASSDTTQTPIEFKLDAIKLYKFKLSYDNRIVEQSYYTYINELNFSGDFQAQSFEMKTKADLKIWSIKSQGIQLLGNKTAKINLGLRVDKNTQQIVIPSSTIEIEKLPFIVSGLVTKKKMEIAISGKNLKLQDVTNNFLVNYGEITKYQGKGIVTFHLLIVDDMIKESPTWVDCKFKFKNGQLKEPSQNIQLTNINVDGQYSNMKGINKEFLHLKTFNFNSQAGPFEGQFLMTDFSSPRFQGFARGNLDLKGITGWIQVPYVDSLNGSIKTNMVFDIQTISSGYHLNTLSGDLQLSGVALKLKEFNKAFSNLRGMVVFNKDEAYFEEMGVQVGESNVQLNGEIKNIQSYLANQGILSADVELSSDYIDIADLDMSGNSEVQISNNKERAYRLPIDIQAQTMLFVRRLRYRTHEFTNLRSRLKIEGRKMIFTDMNVENAGNSVQGGLIIEETRPEYFWVETNLLSKGIDFKRLFKEWKNFDQQVITDQNISGYAVVGLHLKAPFDWESGIVKKEIVSSINLEVMDGRLKNVDLFKSIITSLRKSATKLVISKRQLDLFEKRLMNIKFDKLSNVFTINNEIVSIPDMIIKSDALDLNLSGWHNFDNKIDYHFSFRFRDIKTINNETEFGEVEDDGTGIHIYLKMTGDLLNPQISWDSDAKKKQNQQNIEKEKEKVRSILKSEFGIGKRDSSIQKYQNNVKKNVSFDIDFGERKESPDVKSNSEESKLKKNIQEKIKKAKKERQKEPEFEIE